MIGTRLKDAPTDIDELARILGISLKQLRGLREKHGDDLLLHLRRAWRDKQDRPHMLAQRSEHGYTDQPSLAMSNEPEAVPESYQAKLSAEARLDFAALRAKRQREVDPKALAARMRQIEDLARKKGIDAAPHLMRFESALRAAEAELEAAALTPRPATSKQSTRR